VAPDNLIDQVVGFINLIGNTIVIDVESRIVAPVVAAAIFRPLDVAGADILDLGAIVDKCVRIDFIFFGTGGEMNADLALLEGVVADLVEVGVIDKE